MTDKVGADDAVAAGVPIEDLPRADAPEPHTTDLGNSERFVRQHAAEVRYCYAFNSWLQWTGKRWERDPGDGARERAKQTARRLYAEAGLTEDPRERKALGAWAIKTESDRVQRAMIALAQSALPIRPDKLDAFPSLFNADNCTLDLQTGEHGAHQARHFLTQPCPTPYDPAAACPNFL